MIAVKQELERAEERIELVEYRSAERASEIEEGLDSYVTRVRHMHSSLKKSGLYLNYVVWFPVKTDHFRIHFSLCFKASLSARVLLQ